MIGIKEQFDRLENNEKNRLLYAFEHGITQYHTFFDGTYVGVNSKHLPHLTVEQETDTGWCVGIDKCKQ